MVDALASLAWLTPATAPSAYVGSLKVQADEAAGNSHLPVYWIRRNLTSLMVTLWLFEFSFDPSCTRVRPGLSAEAKRAIVQLERAHAAAEDLGQLLKEARAMVRRQPVRRRATTDKGDVAVVPKRRRPPGKRRSATRR